MLFTTLRKLKIRKGLTEDLKSKIDVFYALSRLTEKEYSELMDVNKEEYEMLYKEEYPGE